MGTPRWAGRTSEECMQKPLGQLLKEMELVTEGQIQEGLQIQREKGGALGDILVGLNYITNDELLLALGAQMGMEVVPMEEMEVPPEVIDLVPASLAISYKVIPIKKEGDVLTKCKAPWRAKRRSTPPSKNITRTGRRASEISCRTSGRGNSRSRS